MIDAVPPPQLITNCRLAAGGESLACGDRRRELLPWVILCSCGVYLHLSMHELLHVYMDQVIRVVVLAAEFFFVDQCSYLNPVSQRCSTHIILCSPGV